MIACRPWQAPFPLQKPRCVTANCHLKKKKKQSTFKYFHKIKGQKCVCPTAANEDCN